jgi:hypothetical protein
MVEPPSLDINAPTMDSKEVERLRINRPMAPYIGCLYAQGMYCISTKQNAACQVHAWTL